MPQILVKSKDYLNGLKRSIENDEITYYDYQDFNDFSEVGSGGFSSVYTANWKYTRSKFAIKKFDRISIPMNDVINEVG